MCLRDIDITILILSFEIKNQLFNCRFCVRKRDENTVINQFDLL